MIVEFFGSSGSGKTAVVRHLDDREPRLHRRCANGWHRLTFGDVAREPERRLKFALSPLASPSFALACRKELSSKASFQDLGDLCFRNWYTQRLRRFPNEAHILDEGPLHRTCALASIGVVYSPASLLEQISLPDLAIYMHVDEDVAFDRLLHRLQAAGHQPTPRRRDRIRSRHRNYVRAAEAIAASGKLPVVTIDSNVDRAEAIGQVKKVLERVVPPELHVTSPTSF